MSLNDVENTVVDTVTTTKTGKTTSPKAAIEIVGDSVVLRNPGVKGKPRRIAVADVSTVLSAARAEETRLEKVEQFVLNANKSR